MYYNFNKMDSCKSYKKRVNINIRENVDQNANQPRKICVYTHTHSLSRVNC